MPIFKESSFPIDLFIFDPNKRDLAQVHSIFPARSTTNERTTKESFSGVVADLVEKRRRWRQKRD